MYLFGGIDQKKKQREGTSGNCSDPRREPRSALDQLIEIRRMRFSPASRATASPEPIDNLERFISLDTLNHSAKRSAQVPNVFVERKIFRTNIVLRSRNSCGFSHRE